jgi:hypothetical protein
MKAFAWILPAAIFAVFLSVLPTKADTPSPGDDEGKIPGMTVARPDKTYLGIEIHDGVFKLSTYNEHKKPVKVEFSQAVLRWPVHYQPNDERTLLTPSDDGMSLTSEKTVKSPHSFRLYISLFVSGKEDPVESYTVDFQE